MYRLIITPRAGSEIQRIYDYIAQDSLQNAASMVQRLLDALELVLQFPKRTVVSNQSPRLRHPVRSVSVEPYIIFYRALDDKRIVRVLSVRHGARQRPKRF